MLDVVVHCAGVWPEGKFGQGEPRIYEILRALHIEGRLGLAYVEEDGAFEGYK